MIYRNLTQYAVRLNDGRVFEPTGVVARVSVDFSEITDDVAVHVYGDVANLPAEQEGVRYIVSALVRSTVADRDDVVAPATGHPATVRNEKGHIVSVPCFTL